MATHHLHKPAPPLDSLVDLIWVSEDWAPPHAQERLMPGGNMNLVISWDRSGRFSAGASGVQTASMMLDTSKPFSILGVSFTAGGSFPFFPMPVGELHNLFVPLESVWGPRAGEVCDRVVAAKTPAAKVAVMECALLSAARGRREQHASVRYGIAALRTQRPVARVVDDVGLSQRRFIEIFRNEVGVTPKAFARVHRFQRVLGCIEHHTEVDWPAVALDAGYFDQAHFIHDFREFAGVSPSMYLKYRESRNHVAVHD